MSLNLDGFGDVKLQLGDPTSALAAYRDSLVVARKLAIAAPDNATAQDHLRYVAERLGGLANNSLDRKEFSLALEASELALGANTNQLWLLTNEAHALMFLRRTDEARAIYLTHRGEMADNEVTWEAAILGDFAEFRKKGLTDPLMDEIEADFAKPPTIPAPK